MIRTLFVSFVSLVFFVGVSTIAVAQEKELRLSTRERVTILEERLEAVEGLVAQLQGLLDCVSKVTGPINGLAGPHIIFEGCNVHVRSGSGATNDNTTTEFGGDGTGTLTGLGNLIVGYNEQRDFFSIPPAVRNGSNNLIVGAGHEYTNFGGFVAGVTNTVSGRYASVSGGAGNIGSGIASSVSGGQSNEASNVGSSVSGGDTNKASGVSSSVTGGLLNVASGDRSSVSGGRENEAKGLDSSVSGGFRNLACGGSSNVSGGERNSAGTLDAEGTSCEGDGFSATVSGGQSNTASGLYSSVSGGFGRSAIGQADWVAGTLFEEF